MEVPYFIRRLTSNPLASEQLGAGPAHCISLGCGEPIEKEPEEAPSAMEGPPEVGMAGGAMGELPDITREPAGLRGRRASDETALSFGEAAKVEDEAVRVDAGVGVPPVHGGAMALAGNDQPTAGAAQRPVRLLNLQSIRGLL